MIQRSNSRLDDQILRPRFGLALLLILLGAAAVLLGIWSESARRQRRAVAVINRLGTPLPSRATHAPRVRYAEPEGRVPRFVGGLLGKDYVATVRSLDIGLGHRDYPFSEWPRTPDEDAALAAIADLPHLRSLDIYFASLRDADLARLSHLTGLTYLGIKGAKLTGKAFGYLRGMTRLTELRAARYGMFPDPRASDWPAWVADDSDAVNFLEGMREIAWLDLEGRPIGDAHLSFLQGEHLHTLCLDNTAVTDAGMEILSRRIAPGHLDANGTRVTDRGAAAVARIRTIGIVGLGFTDVTDAAIRELAALPALWDLRIGNREHPERVTVKGVKALCRARSLRKLRLSGANFNTTQLDEIKAALPGVEVQCDNDPAALSIMRKREFTP